MTPKYIRLRDADHWSCELHTLRLFHRHTEQKKNTRTQEEKKNGRKKENSSLWTFPSKNYSQRHYFPILTSILLTIHENTNTVDSAENMTSGFRRTAVLDRWYVTISSLRCCSSTTLDRRNLRAVRPRVSMNVLWRKCSSPTMGTGEEYLTSLERC